MEKKKYKVPLMMAFELKTSALMLGSKIYSTNATHTEGGIEGGNGGDGLAKQGQSFEEDWDEDWE